MRTKRLRTTTFYKPAIGLLLCAMTLTGCSRSFWRQNADNEIYALIPEKLTDRRWDLPRIDITPAPESRLFDPYPIDKGPLPPDDPAASQYMRSVNGIRQSRSWHKFGTALSIENPHWLEPFGLAPADDGSTTMPVDEEIDLPPAPAEAALIEGDTSNDVVRGQCPNGVRVLEEGQYGIENLTLEQALELSYIHSREYQTEIENLYLQALNLTFDRFQFNVRFLGIGGMEPTADATFESIPRVENSLTTNKRFGVSQLLPAGGQWAVELANSTVWLFAGPNQTNTATSLSYSLVQPLLLGAGRKVVLEGLTQSERDTLYAARDLARFRKTFFADVVGNGQNGFLGILLQTQLVANRRNNIRQLEKQVEILRAETSDTDQTTSLPLQALPPGVEIPQTLGDQFQFDPDLKLLQWKGTMSAEQEQILRMLRDSTQDKAFQATINDFIVQLRTEKVNLDVAQLESRLAGSINDVRQFERGLLDSLDRFKLQLGLPPDLTMTLDESLLDQFQLIESRFFALEKQITDYVEVISELEEGNRPITRVRTVATGLDELRQGLLQYGLKVIDQDLERVDANMPDRLSRLGSEAEREAVRKNVEKDRRLYTSLKNDYREIERDLALQIAELRRDDLNDDEVKQAVDNLSELREDLLRVVQSLQAIQAGARVELIRLQPFNLGREEAVADGLENRLDLKNARAQVMDARRREEVAANRLEAVLDIVAEGDVRTRPLAANRGENPFDFRGRRSSFRVGARFTAPLDQIAERNDYRLALIDYQRARRDYMALEDNVKFSIRQSWRQLQVLNENFEVARQALRLAATQLDLAVEEATAPPKPGQPVQRSNGQQGLNLLNALNSLLEAQNDLIGIWVDYERSRINIYRDMGIMEIDPRGVWNDEFYQQSTPSNPPEADDTEKQLETTAVSGSVIDGGPVRTGRGLDRGLRHVHAEEPQRDSGGGTVRPAGEQFALPRKVELVEDAAHNGAPGGPRRGSVRSRSTGDFRQDNRIRRSGHRSR